MKSLKRKMTKKALQNIMEDEYSTICMSYSVTGRSYTMKHMIRLFAKAIFDSNNQ